jgi:enoyl-CoA hydratase/carnithine racemase
MGDPVLFERRGRVGYVTLNRPDAMNALDGSANDALVEVWKDTLADDEILVCIVTGAGDRAFCAGADLKSYTPLLAAMGSWHARGLASRPGFGGITRALPFWKPVIAAVNGYAIGGGLELALACDIRVAAENAQFASQEIKWGFHHCDGGTVRLPLIVGLGHALRMILTGDTIDADEAHRIGLVSEVVPAGEAVSAAERIAARIAANGPLGVRSAKEAVLGGIGLSLDEALRRESILFSTLVDTNDFREGPQAFKEKRAPRFTAS